MLLQPGAKLPHTPETASIGSVDKRLVVLCFPADAAEDLLVGLAKYQAHLTAFADVGAEVIGVSDASAERLATLAAARAIGFPLLSDPTRVTLSILGVVPDYGRVQPTVYLFDETATLRATYDAIRYPNLPNPAAVARAARKLNDAPLPAPVSDADWRLGPDDAPVVLIEYSDYQCGHCMTLYAALRAVERALGDRLLLVHRHLPLRATHPLAQLAAEAAEAAGSQGRFWAMHDRLFTAQGALERKQLITYAEEIGLDVTQFIADLNERRHQEAVNGDFKRAVAGGIKLPPTLFVNSILYEGPRTEPALAERIRGLLPDP